MLSSFYSQNFEDVLLARIFSDIERGTYVDIGCHHELQDSVTRHFYERGWSGINVDPVFEHIQEYAYRERDINLNLAAGAMASKSLFTVIDGSGLSSFHETHVESARDHGLDSVHERLVEIRTLNSILDEYLFPGKQIAFLKIDVEGHELEVLKGIDLERFRPIVILVETTKPVSTELVDTAADISDYICNSSYDEVYFDGINSWFLAAEEKPLRLHFFSYPVGVYDGFSPFEIRRALLDQQGLRIRDITVQTIFRGIRRRLQSS